MYSNRYKFWSENTEKLKKIDPNYSSYKNFEKVYLTSNTRFQYFFDLLRDQFKFNENIESCYKIFACDLVTPDETVWGKAIQYCKAKPTPEQEVLTTQIKFIDDNVDNGSFNGGEVTTYNNGMKVYDKIIGDKAFRFFPPNKNNELKYFEYSDDTFTTDYYSGTYSLSGFMPESINESIKRWLDIMNKTSRVIIKEQTIITRNPTKNNPDYAKKQGEIKANADKHAELANLSMEHFVSMPWGNPTHMEQITLFINDLIARGHRGLEFSFFLDGLKNKGYTTLLSTLNSTINKINVSSIDPKRSNPLPFNPLTDPTDEEKLSGDYEEKTIKYFKNPIYYKRGGNDILSTDAQNANDEKCIQALADFYKGCGGRTNRSQATDISLRDDYDTYIQSKEFLQKKKFILACDAKGQGPYTQRFKNTGDLKDMTIALMSRSSTFGHPGKDKSGRDACQIIFEIKR